MGGETGSKHDQIINSAATIAFDPRIQYVQNRTISSSSLDYPADTAIGGGYYFFGPNFKIAPDVQAVPEPTTLLGFGLPILMIGLGKLKGLRKH